MRLRIFLPPCLVATLALSLTAKADNLVTNGGFETGSFSGWNVTKAATGSDIFVSLPGNTGNYSAHFDAFSNVPDSISQTLSTAAGATYLLSFFYSEQEGDATNRDLQAQWNGSVVFDSKGIGPSNYTSLTDVTRRGK